jgi:hypothetical protein
MQRRNFVKKSVAAAIVAATPLALTGLVRADGGGGTGSTSTDTTDWWETTEATETTEEYGTTQQNSFYCNRELEAGPNKVTKPCQQINGKLWCKVNCGYGSGGGTPVWTYAECDPTSKSPYHETQGCMGSSPTPPSGWV